MARLPRPDIAGIPQHVVQRGHNRLPCFLDDEDRQRYLQCLRSGLMRFGCQLHAYVLMDNHVHLLLTPGEGGAVSRLMHTFARNYVGLFNGRHGRTGTLWEGRYKACLVDSKKGSGTFSPELGSPAWQQKGVREHFRLNCAAMRLHRGKVL